MIALINIYTLSYVAFILHYLEAAPAPDMFKKNRRIQSNKQGTRKKERQKIKDRGRPGETEGLAQASAGSDYIIA